MPVCMAPKDDGVHLEAEAGVGIQGNGGNVVTVQPEQVREKLVDLMRRDLIGPGPDRDHDLAEERLSGTNPSAWYLSGFLTPVDDDRIVSPPGGPGIDGDADEVAERELERDRATGDLEQGAPGMAGADDDIQAERPRRRFTPSSLGLTVMVARSVRELTARITWGDYIALPPVDPRVLLPEKADGAGDGELPERTKPSAHDWQRRPREETVVIRLDAGNDGPQTITVPDSAAPQVPGGGLELVVTVADRELPPIDGTPEPVRMVSVFLVNRRRNVFRRYSDVVTVFQARLDLLCDDGFIGQADRSGYGSEDFDLRLADLQYRDVRSWATGHNTSGDWDEPDTAGMVRRVFTSTMPCQTVDRMKPVNDPGVEHGMEALASMARDPERLRGALGGIAPGYRDFADMEAGKKDGLIGERHREVAGQLLANIDRACARIEAGIERLGNDPVAREAFRIMNSAMAMANRQRSATLSGGAPDVQKAPAWYGFQLAFVLLNIEGLCDPLHEDRAMVDLLFFPTGGGKTEAYLGLAAFAIALRRLKNPGLQGAGLSVVMRYTLRLLTLDQLVRATGLICALELMRLGGERLGDWPIEIGLWVGSGVTPNSLGGKGNKREGTLVHKLDRYRKDPQRNPAPVPLKDCPWCGQAFGADSFSVFPNSHSPQRLDIHCSGADCAFSDRPLPLHAVDDVIYRRLPAFMIATVDKFANVAWEGRAGAFFDHVDRHDGTGFYGAAEPVHGKKLGALLPPVDLIIQDELHLVSGPLGTVAGLYETAFDRLASRRINGSLHGPKIVASTATVRRADSQIRALFGRERTAIFPPPGIDRHDSHFARTATEGPKRLYVGLASPGRGPKLIFLKTLQTILAGAAHLAEQHGEDAADPWMTALCYFNSLRELGGARRIVDDEIRNHVARYGRERVRAHPADAPFADRSLRETVELTSRVSTDKVSAARTQLGRPAKDGGIDVALATNMISVGLDIPRLGLMLVQSQPKTTAEYIQATSRVGRAEDRPGLVITLLNAHKPRDLMHYEQFRSFHMSFYRAVEATSVTPFSPRAVDRALAATLVTAVRHFDTPMTPDDAAGRAAGNALVRDAVADMLKEKMAVCGLDPAGPLTRAAELFDAWDEIAALFEQSGVSLHYGTQKAEKRLLQDPLKRLDNDGLRKRHWFAAGRSMRDTEPVSLLKLLGPDGHPLGSN